MWWVYDRKRTLHENVVVSEPHQMVWPAMEKLHVEQGESRRARADGGMFLYYANNRHSLRGSPLAELVWPSDPPFRNVVGKCVDTKTSLVFQNQVRAFWLTEGSKSEDQEKALGMTRLTEALFDASGLYGHPGFLFCQDGMLFDGGVIKTIADIENVEVRNERVFPWEIYIPLEEARAGYSSQYFHRQLVDRSQLCGMFPDKEAEIAKLPPASDDWLILDNADGNVSDLVCVAEAWHMPSRRLNLKDDKVWGRDKNGKFDPMINTGHDGRHVICAEGVTFRDRPWVHKKPPLSFFLPQPDPLGPWSLSVPEMVGGIQLELIKLGKRIQSLIHLHAVPLLAAWRNAKINYQKLTNDYARIIETTTQPGGSLMYIQPQAAPNELFRREEELDDVAQKRVGIPEMMASGTKPPGIDHAPAMQLLIDETSARHTPSHRGWERAFTQIGVNNIEAARMIAEYHPDFGAVYGGDESLEAIKLKDVDLGRDRSKYRVWPVNLLPSSPAAKTSNVVFMLQAGLMADTPEAARARKLLGFPDTKAAFDDTNQQERNVRLILDRVERDGMSVDTMPEPWHNPDLCMHLATERINKLQADSRGKADVTQLGKYFDTARRLKLKMDAEATQAKSAGAQVALLQGQAGGAPGGGAPPQLPPAQPAAAAA